MKMTRLFPTQITIRMLLSGVMVLAASAAVFTQVPQLSLADLLIGLRSQKVTLPERNRILTEAVKERGITFVYTPEIARELTATGASSELLAAIQLKSAPVKPAPTPTPAPTPPPPDYSFYQKRADSNFVKGEYALALADYDKAAELRGNEASVFLGRGRVQQSLKAFDRSVADFDRVIELNPKESAAFLNRGASYEQLGKKELALADYKKAVELDPDNEAANANARRLEDEFAKAEAERQAAARAAARPEVLDAGILTVTQAEKMAVPVYSPMALKANIEGKVNVEVEIDETGKVIRADAVSGHQMLRGAAEDAAKRSRFKPFTWDGTPIKAKGVIVYNFARSAKE